MGVVINMNLWQEFNPNGLYFGCHSLGWWSDQGSIYRLALWSGKCKDACVYEYPRCRVITIILITISPNNVSEHSLNNPYTSNQSFVLNLHILLTSQRWNSRFFLSLECLDVAMSQNLEPPSRTVTNGQTPLFLWLRWCKRVRRLVTRTWTLRERKWHQGQANDFFSYPPRMINHHGKSLLKQCIPILIGHFREDLQKDLHWRQRHQASLVSVSLSSWARILSKMKSRWRRNEGRRLKLIHNERI